MRYNKIWNIQEDMAPDLLDLFRQCWWADDRDLEGTRKVLEGSDLTLGLQLSPQTKLIGFVRVLTDRMYKATIYDIIVDQEYRNKGIGRFLLQSIINHEDIKGIQHVELYCDADMKDFYKQLGFMETEPEVFLLRKIQVDK